MPLAKFVLMLTAATTGHVAIAGPAEDCLAYLDHGKASGCLEKDPGNASCIQPLMGYHEHTKEMQVSYEKAVKCLKNGKSGKSGVDCLPDYMKKSKDYKVLFFCTLFCVQKGKIFTLDLS